ncbi:formate dehydrogenase accessory sulfurtransferase FdhD [Gallaecimonas mangrovi]|uniref:formate dehydrogenase accessory sulfurtransferase FdhD n=1 Tax=Gallaecimonas mangrovi TaxID=2291597 RepID=UPI000E20158D|nr:formate dehydrogenase accessory sulfurtransferase FdhD [Gallaecimonas mangrovi]
MAETDSADFNADPIEASEFSYRELASDAPAASAALASETALAISYNGINQAVMMVSPGNLEDFIRGFSLTNEIVTGPEQIYDISITAGEESHTAEVEIASRNFWALKNSRRQMAGTTGCGICGVEAIDQALPQLVALEASPLPALALFSELRQKVNAAQQVARSSGALHAALYLDDSGKVVLCREDIGRHNALDKLIGAMLHQQVDSQSGMVVMTSRCSLELIHKAVRAKIATLVTLSAPTALTVQWARRYRLNLIHVPHHSPPRVYSPAP